MHAYMHTHAYAAASSRSQRLRQDVSPLYATTRPRTHTYTSKHNNPSLHTNICIHTQGPSGSGKTSLLRKFGDITPATFPAETTPRTHPALAALDERCAPLCSADLLAAVGLGAGAAGRRYGSLSGGERARAEIAVLVAEALVERNQRKSAAGAGASHVLIDEYTSLLDRAGAAALSRSLGCYVARHGVQGVVLATCHQDVVPMLSEAGVLDWVYWTDTASLYTGDTLGALVSEVRAQEDEASFTNRYWRHLALRDAGGSKIAGKSAAAGVEAGLGELLVECLQQPRVELKCCRISHQAWCLFKAHHYLNDEVVCA